MINRMIQQNCLIVDDEPNAIRIIAEYLNSFPNLKLAGTARNAFDAISLLRGNHIELMFLDIQMPEVTGIELLSNLTNPPAVIITTAHRDYAVDAFNLRVLDYLLKPISFERFSIAVNRFMDAQKGPIPSTMVDSEESPVLVIRCDRKEIRLPMRDILYLQSMGDYVKVFCESGEKLLILETLGGILGRLPDTDFVRIHRGYVISRRHIRAIGTDSVTIGTETLPLSRNYRNVKWTL